MCRLPSFGGAVVIARKRARMRLLLQKRRLHRRTKAHQSPALAHHLTPIHHRIHLKTARNAAQAGEKQDETKWSLKYWFLSVLSIPACSQLRSCYLEPACAYLLTYEHFLFSRFLLGSSDSESEDERRVVRSAKDRATEELLSICNEIRVRYRQYYN